MNCCGLQSIGVEHNSSDAPHHAALAPQIPAMARVLAELSALKLQVELLTTIAAQRTLECAGILRRAHQLSRPGPSARSHCTYSVPVAEAVLGRKDAVDIANHLVESPDLLGKLNQMAREDVASQLAAIERRLAFRAVEAPSTAEGRS